MKTREKISYVNKLRQKIKRDMIHIPNFLDMKKMSHKQVWDEIKYSLQTYSKLTNDNFLNENQVLNIKRQMDVHFELISDITNPENNLTIVNYLFNLYEEYFEYALELELYEICANFKKYLKMA